MILNLKPGRPPRAHRGQNSRLFCFHTVGQPGPTIECNSDKELLIAPSWELRCNPATHMLGVSALRFRMSYCPIKKKNYFCFGFLYLQISLEPLFWATHLARLWEFRAGWDAVAVREEWGTQAQEVGSPGRRYRCGNASQCRKEAGELATSGPLSFPWSPFLHCPLLNCMYWSPMRY